MTVQRPHSAEEIDGLEVAMLEQPSTLMQVKSVDPSMTTAQLQELIELDSRFRHEQVEILIAQRRVRRWQRTSMGLSSVAVVLPVLAIGIALLKLPESEVAGIAAIASGVTGLVAGLATGIFFKVYPGGRKKKNRRE